MLKPIPQEIGDDHPKDCKCRRSRRSKKVTKDASPNIKKKCAVLENEENKLLRSIGRRLFGYGKKASQKTSCEIQAMIREMQKSILCLQKQQRAAIRKQQKKKNRKRK
jgi:hypothetical protein